MKKIYVLIFAILLIGCRKELMTESEYDKFMGYVKERNLVAAKEMEKNGFDVNGDLAPSGKGTIILQMIRKYNDLIYNEKGKEGQVVLDNIKWLLDNFEVNINRRSYQRSFEGFAGLFERFWIEESRSPLSCSLDGGKDRQGDFEMFKLLLSHGADPCVKSNNGLSAIEEVSTRNLEKFKKHLEEKNIICNSK